MSASTLPAMRQWPNGLYPFWPAMRMLGEVRLLERFGDVADARLGVHVLLQPDRPELALDLVGRLGAPQPQDHVDGLIDHGGGVLRVGSVELLVSGDAACPEAEVEPAFREV